MEVTSGDNQSKMLNITNGSSAVVVVSNDSESDNTGSLADRSNAEDINVYQDATNTIASLQTDSEVFTDANRNKTTKLASELAKGAIDKAEQALNENKNGAANNPTTIVTTQGNLSEATDVAIYSDQLVDHGSRDYLILLILMASLDCV